MLQIWVIKCNEKCNNGKIQNFTKSTKTSSPTGCSGATCLPPIGNSLMYIQTSCNVPGNIVLSAWNKQILFNLEK